MTVLYLISILLRSEIRLESFVLKFLSLNIRLDKDINDIKIRKTLKKTVINYRMVMYIENLKMFSVKFLELKCESVDKKDQYRNQLFFSSQQLIENQILKSYLK